MCTSRGGWCHEPMVRCVTAFVPFFLVVILLSALSSSDILQSAPKGHCESAAHAPGSASDGLRKAIRRASNGLRSDHSCSRRQQWSAFPPVVFAAAASPEAAGDRNFSEDTTESHAAQQVPEPSLSLLQSYLYSVEAAEDAVLIGGALQTTTLDTASPLYHATGSERSLSVAAEEIAQNNPTSSSSSSSSSSSASSAHASSLGAYLSGRYVVLSRIPSWVRSSSSSRLSGRGVERGSQRRGSSGQQYGCGGARCGTVGKLDAGIDAAAELGSKRTARVRVFPEEALQRVAAATAAFRERMPYPTGAPSAPVREQWDIGNTSRTGDAAGTARPPEQRTSFSQSYAQGARPTRTASLKPLPELEVHVVDADHVLVYLPFASDDSSPSVSLLQALAAPDSDGGALWRMWDVFASRGGAKLKLSDKLRDLSETVEVTTGPHTAKVTAQRGGHATPSLLPLEVTLWTARGMAGAVHRALARAPRLRRFFQESSAATGSPACSAQLLHVNEEMGTVVVSIKTRVPPQIVLEVDASIAELSLRQSNSSHSPHHSHGQEVLYRSCLRDVLLTVAAHPAVRWVEETMRHAETLNNVAASVIQYGHCSSYAPDAISGTALGGSNGAKAAEMLHPFWGLGWNGTGEIIAISDSGVDVQNCFFRDDVEPVAIYPNVSLRHRKILSYYAYKRDGHPPDTTDHKAGHGTHVAGTAVGYCIPNPSTASAKMTNYNGVATGARLFVRDLAPNDTKSLLLPTNVLDLFTVARGVGARISSNSWGLSTASTSYLAVEKMIDSFVAKQRDMLIIMASGNQPERGLYMPARAKNVLTVGAHPNSADGFLQDSVSSFSSSGPTYDNRRKPELLAPGGGSGTVITSAKSTSGPRCDVYESQGTSMATGAVAGAAAIMRQYLREHWRIEEPSAALLRAALVHSTTNISASPHPRSDFGRLDLSLFLPHASHSLEGVLAPIEHWILDDAVVTDDEIKQYCFALSLLSEQPTSVTLTDNSRSCRLAQASTVMATLVWSDPGLAVEGSKRSQVHDLDLMLVTQFGTTYYAAAGGKRDDSGTVEQVRALLQGGSDSPAGEWAAGFRVLVRGASIRNPEGQSFALTVSAPGLTAVRCADLFSDWRQGEAAPHVTAAGAFCPVNCSHHGSCDPSSLLCSCDSGYASVDCAECNADVVCHGHGMCTAPSMQCTCDPRGHFADAQCSVCAEGWYGPLCDSDCVCQNGGVCDKSTGQCTCLQSNDLGKSCFDGNRCQYCCEGRAGEACDQRSYWCNTTGAPVLVDDAGGGYIQVNGYGAYPYSTTCRWQLQARTGQQVHLDIITYNIEMYDRLKVYDVLNSSNPKHVRRQSLGTFSGVMHKVPLPLTSTENRMDVEFVSDWEGVAPGFLLFYRFTRCSSRCQSQNLTGQPGHWCCGDNIGLPKERCLCKPPYVGWHCDKNASDVGVLSKQLNALQVSSKSFQKGGDLAWMVPCSSMAAAEARLSVSLKSGHSLDWQRWRDSTDSAATLTVPVRGIARAPLIVQGFTWLYLPPLTLPTAALLGTGQSHSVDGSQIVEARLRLTVQLQADRTWMDKHAKRLGLSLGVSSASEKVSRVDAATKQNTVLEPLCFSMGSHGIAAATPLPQAPLSIAAFNFTPIVLRDLHDCVDAPEIEVGVPLYLAPSNAPSGIPSGTNTSATTTATHSQWTTRVVLSLLWNARAGVVVANESVLDAVVVAQEVRLTRAVQSRSGGTTPSTSAPSAGSTASGRPVEVECRTIARVPALSGQRLVKSAHHRTVPDARHLSWREVLLVFGIAVCVGVAGSVLQAAMQRGSLCQRTRKAYVVILNAEETHEMQPVDQPHV